MEKVPGCWEHMFMVWESLKSSKASKSSVSAVWLDVANAYGSIPHKLIFFALIRYGVPEKWIDIVMSYYVVSGVNLSLRLHRPVGIDILKVFLSVVRFPSFSFCLASML